MKPIKFQACRFCQSSDGKVIPKAPIPHFVLIGRSNVGKSSLVNHLFKDPKLARVSQKPGKTTLLQFYLIDEGAAFLVDLPGYGFAKRSKTDREEWGAMVQGYLEEKLEDIVFLHLLDSRHPPTELDWQFIEWANSLEKKVVFILTKTDKIKKSIRERTLKEYMERLGDDVDAVPYSILEGYFRDNLIRQLNKRVAICEI